MFQKFSVICGYLASPEADAFDEDKTKEVIIEPILQCFGWDTSLCTEAVREWGPPDTRDRIDYAFFPHDEPHLPVVPDSVPVVLLEAKRTNRSLRQEVERFVKYLERPGGARFTSLAVLTNGIEWWFFLVMNAEEIKERYAYKVNLRNTNIKEAYEVFDAFLRREYWLRRTVEDIIVDPVTWRMLPPDGL